MMHPARHCWPPAFVKMSGTAEEANVMVNMPTQHEGDHCILDEQTPSVVVHPS